VIYRNGEQEEQENYMKQITIEQNEEQRAEQNLDLLSHGFVASIHYTNCCS
jgi:hypothetical protein